jgi:hypothetical protein
MHRMCPVAGGHVLPGRTASAFVPKTTTQGRLPEICQKLRYT